MKISEIKSTCEYLLDNNRNLKYPISICIEGESGNGKTSLVQQIASEKNMGFFKINLAQIEEPSELVGFPYKEYERSDGRWISSDIINNNDEYTGNSRMNYAVPSWVPKEENENGTILLLDDFSRANNLIIQAVMEIINQGQYLSWHLPKYTNIILTSNPDNGKYNVQSLDSAIVSRMITLSMEFNINDWSKWAETEEMDSRCINFAIMYNDELFSEKNNVTLANARGYTTFSRAISGIKNWEDVSSLDLINKIASGCFQDKNNTIGKLFVQFVMNKLDKLSTPEHIWKAPFDVVKQDLEKELLQPLGDEKENYYRTDIANLLSCRMLHYADAHFNSLTGKKILSRIKELKASKLFSLDMLFQIVKTLSSSHTKGTNSWFADEEIRQILI